MSLAIDFPFGTGSLITDGILAGERIHPQNRLSTASIAKAVPGCAAR